MGMGRGIRTILGSIAAFMVRGIELVTLVVIAATMASTAVVLVATLCLRVDRIIALSSDSVSELVNMANYFLLLS